MKIHNRPSCSPRLHADNVGVIERGRQIGFAIEPRPEVRIG